MYKFYETTCYKTLTSITRTVHWRTMEVTVSTPKNRPKSYHRELVREVVLKQYRIGRYGYELAGAKVNNHALGITIQRGGYWP